MDKLSLGSPLFFYQLTPEGELIGEWIEVSIVGEFDGHWLVNYLGKIYSVDQHSLSSERINFYTKIHIENEPRCYSCIYESLRQYFMFNRHDKMAYKDLRAMYDIANNYAGGA
ncbi:hypothetical protein [Photobacterium carnosum]|uniref:hypothetical protein n=1 Tax=Photobacterium carnosum TaxID=2023717 RepID=UPI001E319DBA|nr:hypothetical protein [Photobacterium carnosum]MCD9516987.1 hypothetical protein [Photobacterium carnosum]